MRSYSIVKPKDPKEGSPEDETLVAPDSQERTSVREVWEGGDNSDNSDMSERKPPVKYTDIRNKFSHLLNKDRAGPARTLFRQESGDDHPRFYQSDSSGSSSRGGSEVRSLSEDTRDKSLSASCESLDHMESLPESPARKTREGRLPTLEEVTPVSPEPPLDKTDSRTNLMKTPVTQDDPLGALSPMVTPAKAVSIVSLVPFVTEYQQNMSVIVLSSNL